MVLPSHHQNEILSRLRSVPQWIWAAMLIASSVIIVKGVVQTNRMLSSHSWPTTSGTVVLSEIARSHLREGILKYKIKIVYRYDVNGIRYESGRLSFSGVAARAQHAQGIAATYRKGDTVTVHYHPSDPGLSVLETGVAWSGFKALLLGLALAPLSFIGLWRRWSLQTDYLFRPYDPDAPLTVQAVCFGALGLLACLGIIWIWWELIKMYAGR